jgi:UDP-N-acetylglucosamine enolpyruvyl transferase
VTATENALMAAATAGANDHPQCGLNHMSRICPGSEWTGARFRHGTNMLVVDGVDSPSGGSHSISTDHTEIASIIAPAVTKSQVIITNVDAEHLRMIKLLSAPRRAIDVQGSELTVPYRPAPANPIHVHGAIPRSSRARGRASYGP